MKRILSLFSVAVLASAASVAVFAAIPSSAEPGPSRGSTNGSSNGDLVFRRNVVSLAAAQRLANAALADCAKRGFPVTVAVVDSDGVDVVLLRADGATGATVDVARGKAHAAAGFQSPTAGLNQGAQTNPGLIALPNFVILAGGQPIRSGNTTIGGVGVSGAPSGDIDDQCAAAGLRAIGLNT